MSKNNRYEPLPFALVEGNVEGLHARHRNRGRGIYLTVVLALLLAFAALPLVRVTIHSSARGMLRPALQRAPVTVGVGGRVVMARLAENRSVCVGDTLLIISAAELGPEVEILRRQIREHRLLRADLRQLTASATAIHPSLQTAVYQRDYQDYRRSLEEAHLQTVHAGRHFARQKQLFATRTIARVDYEQAEFDLRLARQREEQITARRAHLWSQEGQRVERELQELNSRLRRQEQRATDFVVTAPVEGSLTETAGLQAGAFTTAGQTVAVISPDGGLHVEAFVSPADIGLLRQGMEVQIQLDAFNHHQWGLAHAIVTDIDHDASTGADERPVFRVRCRLREEALQLRNGYVGRLKKGMTLTAHFTLARRSLFQLLHDKLDDWINPQF